MAATKTTTRSTTTRRTKVRRLTARRRPEPKPPPADPEAAFVSACARTLAYKRWRNSAWECEGQIELAIFNHRFTPDPEERGDANRD